MSTRIKHKKVTDYTLDPKNINRGSAFGMSLLERSIRETGLGRSLLADKNGVMIAGNKTMEKASELGIENVIEIETDGKSIVVVKRTDLDINSEQGAKAKILDNTVSKHNYVEEAEVAEAICSEVEIMNLNTYGLKSPQMEDSPDDQEQISFTRSNKPVIKIEFVTLSQMLEAEKDIHQLLNDKWSGARLTIRGK